MTKRAAYDYAMWVAAVIALLGILILPAWVGVGLNFGFVIGLFTGGTIERRFK